MAVEHPARRETLRRALFLGAVLTPINIWTGVNVGQFALRPLQLWTLCYIPLALATDRNEIVRAFDATSLVFVCLFAALGMSTVIATPPTYQLRAAADLTLLALNIGAFIAVHGALSRRPELLRDFLRWFAIGATANAVVLGVRALSLSRQKLLQSTDSNVFGLGTVIGTYESALTAAAVVALIFAPTRRSARAAAVLLVANGALAVLALARGPWLAAAGAVAITVPLAAWQLRHLLRPRELLRRLALPIGVLATTVIALAATDLARLLVIVNRVLALSEAAKPISTGGTAAARLFMWSALIDDSWRSPLFGHGAASYREIAEFVMITNQISENFLIEIAHAGGALSLTLLVIGVGLCVSSGLRNDAKPQLESVMLRMAVIAGALTVFLGSLTNPSAWNSMFWVVMACAASPYRPRTAS
jgi:hypothetical protein